MAKPNKNAIRILLADDHALLREALRLLLEGQPDFHVVGEARDGEEAVKLVRRLKPDVLLLDLAMPRMTGLEALRELATCSSGVRTILLVATIEKHQIVEALRLGARGVVLKESASELLLKCIRTIMAGQYWVGREGVTDLVDYVRELATPTPQEKAYGLTARELDVVAAIVSGSTNKDIAEKFSIREDTVKHHLTSIFDKLGVSNRLELALFAVHKRLLEDKPGRAPQSRM